MPSVILRKICLVFNESIHETVETDICADWLTAPVLYDPMDEKAESLEKTARGFRLKLTPGAFAILQNDGIRYSAGNRARTEGEEVPLSEWKVSLATAKEYPAFQPCPSIREPRNLFAPDGLKDFSGTIRYETTFSAREGDRLILRLGTVGETAEVFLNECPAGVKIAPPYDFELTNGVREGLNRLTIDVTNTLVYKMKDIFSVYHALQPSGLVGPVQLKKLVITE